MTPLPPCVVMLTQAERLTAAVNAGLRIERKLAAGQQDVAGAEQSVGDFRFTNDYEAACAELAFCRALNVYPQGFARQSVPDASPDWEVRWTRRDNGRLILRPRDDEQRRWVLVTGELGRYVVRGWLYGHEARREEWWEAPAGREPAWFVPQSALRPLLVEAEAAP